jgi:hypothetical protein
MTGMHVKLIATGEVQDVARPEAPADAETAWEIVRWFPDGTRFIANSHPAAQDATDWSAQDSSIWVFSVLRGAPRKLRDDAEAFSLSPDGAWIAFGTKPARVIPVRGNLKMGGTRAYPGHFGDREVWRMTADGQQPQKLYETEEGSTIIGLQWSGDGKRTLYLKTNESGAVIETNDLQGGLPKEVLRFPVGTRLRDYLWMPDGRLGRHQQLHLQLLGASYPYRNRRDSPTTATVNELDWSLHEFHQLHAGRKAFCVPEVEGKYQCLCCGFSE